MMRVLCALALLAAPVFAQTNAELKEQVRRTETAFAKTMADRDHAAFAKFLAEEAVFISNGKATRGAKALAVAGAAFSRRRVILAGAIGILAETIVVFTIAPLTLIVGVSFLLLSRRVAHVR